MLNEERVKHMVKLARYEAGGGDEEIKISFYHKKDYINYNMWRSILWFTLAYILLTVLMIITFMNSLAGNLTVQTFVMIAILIGGIYIALLVAYIVLARKFYKKKHARAYHRVKRFKQDLVNLENMYEKEDSHGEAI